MRLRPEFQHFTEPLQRDNILPLDDLTRRRSLFFLIMLPYIKSKLDRLYDKWAGPLTPFGRIPPREPEEEVSEHNNLAKLLRLLKRAFVLLFPVFHVFWEGTRLVSQWQFAVGETQYFSPLLRWLGVSLLRIDETDQKDFQQRAEDIKEMTLGRIARNTESTFLRFTQQAFFKMKWAVLEYANFGFMLFAVAFKVHLAFHVFLPFFPFLHCL